MDANEPEVLISAAFVARTGDDGIMILFAKKEEKVVFDPYTLGEGAIVRMKVLLGR